MTAADIGTFSGATLRLAMPLALAATGEMVSERAGVLNMSLDGMMLTAAFAGALGSWATGQPLIGLACGLLAALVLALWQAAMSVTLRANQLVVGIGFNILALGATTFLYREIFGAASRDLIPGFARWPVPSLAELPVLGPALFQQTALGYAGLALIALTWLVLAQTGFGLSVRAVGEDPRGAEKAGIDVRRIRYYGVLYAGAMAGLAGCFLSIADIDTFTEGMTNGAGYLALAAVIFGGWKGWRTFLACLLFGSATALQFLLPDLGVNVPVAALLLLPYLLALFAVAGLVGRIRPPSALTLPYVPGR
ncbi:ABC transporter permease [Acidiphilium sp.]|uniref:ABC transporter permease n=1 Tax=Acidiphilium sp. TaxID=527 RepID=UPI0025901B21|nr:ABC transporter permease [Acidiphilium sp.]